MRTNIEPLAKKFFYVKQDLLNSMVENNFSIRL